MHFLHICVKKHILSFVPLQNRIKIYNNRQNHIFPGSGTEFAWEESLSIYYAIVDVNQDGIVYLLTNAKGKETAIDAADLKKWVDSYRKGAKEIPITYQRLK